MDLSTTYKSFAESFFPKARIIADKFHVIRLLNNPLNKYRKKVENLKTKEGLRLRKILLMSSKKLDYWIRTDKKRA